MSAPRAGSSSELLWCAVVGFWSLVFAAPHFYWATGGRGGLGDQTAAADAALQQSWFAIYNLTAGCLGVVGAVVAVALVALPVGGIRRVLLIFSAFASVVLLLRGTLGLFLLSVSVLNGTSEEVPAILLAIEPWFMLGGLVFGGMVLSQRKKHAGDAVRRHQSTGPV